MKGKAGCDCCIHNRYDEDYEACVCQVDLDEDEYVRVAGGTMACPHFRYDDEYRIVRKQM